MKKNNLFASMASKALALAAVVMMSVAFTACSSDDDDTPPTPEQTNNYVIIDGVKKSVLSHEFNNSDNQVHLHLYLSADKKESVSIGINSQYCDKDIDLTDQKHTPEKYQWDVDYYDANDKSLFEASGNSDPRGCIPFTTGTLRIYSNKENDELSVTLKDGSVTDPYNGDKKPHTISVSWKGKGCKVAPPEIFTNTVTIDDVDKPITGASIVKSDFDEDHYYIKLYMGEDEYINIMADEARHDGKTIDLTKKEQKSDGWYWSVEYLSDSKKVFDTYSNPDNGLPVFSRGTMKIKHVGYDYNSTPIFEIKIDNGKVKSIIGYGDGKEHTISLSFQGTATKK